MTSPGHELVIVNIREGQAVCRCGAWRYLFPTFDTDREEEIVCRMRKDWSRHVGYATAQSRKEVVP